MSSEIPKTLHQKKKPNQNQWKLMMLMKFTHKHISLLVLILMKGLTEGSHFSALQKVICLKKSIPKLLRNIKCAFSFLVFPISHLNSLKLFKIFNCWTPTASARYPCSFFHGSSSVLSKCFTNIPQFAHSLTGLQDEKALLSPPRIWEQRG